MKKKLFIICFAAITGVLAAVNLNLAFNSDSNVNLSMTGIIALAQGETTYCSICGNQIDACSCPPTITCDYASCHGKDCHIDTYNWICPCDATGYLEHICSI